MMHLVVYLRDTSDFALVRDCLNERCGHLPMQIVQAPVCRPDWLIEVEGIAIIADTRPSLPRF